MFQNSRSSFLVEYHIFESGAGGSEPDGGAGAVTQMEHSRPVDVQNCVETRAIPAIISMVKCEYLGVKCEV